jgi:hypothetical protein
MGDRPPSARASDAASRPSNGINADADIARVARVILFREDTTGFTRLLS